MASWQDYTYLKKIICKMTKYPVSIILNIYFLYNIFLSNISIKKLIFRILNFPLCPTFVKRNGTSQLTKNSVISKTF